MNAMTDHRYSTTPAASEEDSVVHDARALIPDGVKATIVLDEQVYTLRITRAGKLILTK
ncbi:hemin uptake protein HemP [Marivita sp. S6314]|uniref:hemin uptake protein HemP n=1 Tax=Marivita sp. S6314 TaxID=2926406 RepID=UPI001FF3D56A|nr:hemin uptake protein HemP [Marivita sp. S6314]MCK0150493.1 hemin uptake protein HemP [Marivita sp. S6314]